MNVKMGIIKVEVKLPEAVQAIEEFRQNRMRAFDSMTSELKQAVGNAISTLLQSEMTLFLGKPEQSEFKSSIIKPNEQIDPRLKEDMAVLHLAGISTRTMAMISRRVLGVQVSTDTVSESLGTIEEKALEFLTRPIQKRYWALFVDGTNFRIQCRGTTDKEPSLVVLGIDERNCFSILAVEPGTKDNVDAWKAVFSELRGRGLDMNAVRIGIMDGLPGLEKLFRETFLNAYDGTLLDPCTEQCVRKSSTKAQGSIQEACSRGHVCESSENAARLAFQELKAVMGADAERAVHCLEKDLDSLLVHYRFERSLWRALRTTNPIERVNKEFKRRTKSMETLGEKTLQTLVAFTALRMEHNWQVMPANSPSLMSLNGQKQNQIESTMDTLIH